MIKNGSRLYDKNLDVVACACNPGWRVEVGELIWIWGKPSLHSVPHQTKTKTKSNKTKIPNNVLTTEVGAEHSCALEPRGQWAEERSKGTPDT